MHKMAVVLLLIVVVLHNTMGQGLPAPMRQLTFKDGLSNETVKCLLIDSNGFLWFGTQNGLNYYDGYSIKTVHVVVDRISLSSLDVTYMVEDTEDNLWIGSTNGLIRFNRKTSDYEYYSHEGQDLELSLSHNHVTYLYIDKLKQNLWIGTQNGLDRFNLKEKTFEHFIYCPSGDTENKNNDINCIKEDLYGNLWIASWHGWLSKYDVKRKMFSYFEYPKSFQNVSEISTITDIYIDKDQSIWISYQNSISAYFNPVTNEFSSDLAKLKIYNNSNNKVLWSTFDSKGQIWCFDGNLFSIYDPKSKSRKSFSSGLENAKIDFIAGPRSILNVNNENIWIINSVYQCFECVLNTDKFAESYNYLPKNANTIQNYVRDFAIDQNKNEFFGTFGDGLFIKSANSANYQNISLGSNNKQEKNRDYITSMKIDSRKRLWIGTLSGVVVLNTINQTIEKVLVTTDDKSKSLDNNIIELIYVDSKDNVWVATSVGLDFVDSENNIITQYSGKNLGGLSHFDVYDIKEDENGLIWVATKSGLNYFDYKDRKFYFYSQQDYPQLNNTHILSICLAKDKRMWLATREGFFSFDRKNNKMEKVKLDNKPYEYFIYKIIEDNSSDLWMLTNVGLLKYTPMTRNVINYDDNIGMFSNNEAISLTKDGIVFVGGQKSGYYSFDPAKIKKNESIPPVYITDLSINNESVLNDLRKYQKVLDQSIFYSEKIKLNHKQNFFTFEFSALNYTHSEKNNYLYQLEGFDNDWISASASRRFATYNNLNPGDYVFRVKGSNNDGIWNEKGASIKVEILPPFWKSNIAYSLYMIFGISLTGFLIIAYTKRISIKNTIKLEKLKTEKEIELNQLKLRFFTNISHEFRTPLSLISGPIEKLITLSKDENSEKRTYYTLIQRNVTRLKELTDQILDLRKIENNKLKLELSHGDLVEYLSHLIENFRTLANTLKINLSYSTSMNLCDTWFDADKLEKIVDNLLSNAFKYTPLEGEVTIQLSRLETPVGEFARIAVADTGKGISADKLPHVFERFYQVENNSVRNVRGSGIGLSIAREMVLLHHGEINVESDGKYGSVFWFTIPLQLENMSNYILNEGKLMMEPNVKNQMPLYVHQKIEFSSLAVNENIDPEIRHKVLIVEDNEDLRLFIKSILQDYYQVWEAENGLQGVELAKDKQPELIISDIMMPEMDGTSMVRRIKNDINTSHIPIILLTALSSADSKYQGYESGADDYITKPFNHEMLLLRVKSLINNRKMLQDYYTRLLTIESKFFDIAPSEIEIVGVDERFLKNMVAIVEKNLENAEFSIEDLASELNMVYRVLNRKFKALLNRTPGDFIFEMKMKRALQILLQRKVPIVEIADMVGFNDRKYFSICFKKFYGMSPTEYLKNNSVDQF